VNAIVRRWTDKTGHFAEMQMRGPGNNTGHEENLRLLGQLLTRLKGQTFSPPDRRTHSSLPQLYAVHVLYGPTSLPKEHLYWQPYGIRFQAS